jgi:hypothetical protein
MSTKLARHTNVEGYAFELTTPLKVANRSKRPKVTLTVRWDLRGAPLREPPERPAVDSFGFRYENSAWCEPCHQFD